MSRTNALVCTFCLAPGFHSLEQPLIQQKVSDLRLLDGADPEVDGDRYVDQDLTHNQNGDELTRHGRS